MVPKKLKTSKKTKFSKNLVIAVGVIVAIAGLSTYFIMNSSSSDISLLTPAKNNFIVAKYYQDTGYAFASKSTTSGKKSAGASSVNPTINISLGEVEAIHVINEDSDTGSKHNFNIDEFNVHSKDLGYFESQEIKFVADKPGTFKYYCSLHPEMKGEIIVE